jgi:hypothetical protein
VVEVLLEHGPVDKKALAKGEARARFPEWIQDRANEELERGECPSAVAKSVTRRSRKSGACGVAPDAYAHSVQSERRGVGDGPSKDGQAVLERRREPMFGRQPIVYGDHLTSRGVGQPPAKPIMCVEASCNPAAAMQIDQRGRQAAARRATLVDSDANPAVVGGD